MFFAVWGLLVNKIEGGEMRMLNEDEVLATIDSPEDILHEF